MLQSFNTCRIPTFFFRFLISKPSLHSTSRSTMPNPFRCLTDRQLGMILPPAYEHDLECDPVTFKYKYTMPDYHVRNLQRCLIWRMAIDWNLKLHISEDDRPAQLEYFLFVWICESFGYLLGDRIGRNPGNIISQNIIEPGASIGISKSKQCLEHSYFQQTYMYGCTDQSQIFWSSSCFLLGRRSGIHTNVSPAAEMR